MVDSETLWTDGDDGVGLCQQGLIAQASGCESYAINWNSFMDNFYLDLFEDASACLLICQ